VKSSTLTIATFLIAGSAHCVWANTAFEHQKQQFLSSEKLLLDRRGDVLHRLRVDASVRRGAWVPLADISPALRHAMVVSEDRRFYEHSGVDWRAVPAAAWGNLFNQRTRGASTLSMQLASLIEDGPRKGSERRSVFGKVEQVVDATLLERSWRKDQILEAYLNLVPFRGEIQGIEALSRTLFEKAPHGLDEREAAIAAALVRAPNASARVVAQRACGVLKSMGSSEASKCDSLEVFTAAALKRKAWLPSEGIAPHAARLAVKQQITRTTLDARVQRFALQSLQQHLKELKDRNVEDGAVVVLDNASGEVLAYVGSSGFLSEAAEVDAAAALRQAGSTLKPFLYAQAIAEKRLTAASLLDDSSAQIATASGLYIPQNYDRSFKGWVSVRTALGASLNVPAVRTLVMVSPNSFARTLKNLDLPLRQDGDYYGFSLALGSADVSLLSLTNAYRTLANRGLHSAPRFQSSTASQTKRVIDEAASFIVNDILADPLARARTFGTDSILATRIPSAVKTGTSKDMRDNWAVGYSEHYTVGVWVGNASGASMWEVSGTSGAAPVWASVMAHLHSTQSRAKTVSPWTPPTGVQRIRAQYAQTQEAAREEWFMTGTAPQPAPQQNPNAINLIAGDAYSVWANGTKSIKNQDKSAAPHIQAPTSGSIVALDPDIPPQRQRLQLSAQGGADLRWQIKDQIIAKGAQAQWLPLPGRHELQLVNAKGEVLDSVKIEVRGASFKLAGAPPSGPQATSIPAPTPARVK
jgi:penicillin-binding protein 1C